MNDAFLFSETALAVYNKHIWTQLFFNEVTKGHLTLPVLQKLVKIFGFWYTTDVIFIGIFLICGEWKDPRALFIDDREHFFPCQEKMFISLNFR